MTISTPEGEVSPGNTALDANEVCRHCMMCCDGTLFSHVIVNNKDADFINNQGMELVSKSDQISTFDQPCSQARDGGCAIYENRPEKCRSYYCKLQKNILNGSISFEKGREVVSLAKMQAREIMQRADHVIVGKKEKTSVRSFIKVYLKNATVVNRLGKLSPRDALFVKVIFEHVKLIDRHFQDTDLLMKYANLIQGVNKKTRENQQLHGHINIPVKKSATA